jgi:hypothetical protein
MTVTITRRDLIRSGAAATAFAGAQFFTGVPALADYAVGPTMRRNASTMAESDPILRGYRRAIVAMRALPDTNPCSWFYQAAIHGTTDPRNLTAWNTCHTDPTFFWAWHRMYLYWFERIVRKHANMYDWALPYWDWANPAERAIPAPFRNASSVLFDSTRFSSMNSGGLLSTGLATSVNNAMALTDYFNTQSSMNGPHGSVHVSVGGNMGAVNSAGRDALFWIHHAQVDRLWNLWLAQGGGRSSPVGNATWRNTTYTFFDECCNPVTMKGCDVLRAALQLSYSYQGEPSQVNQYCPRIWVFDRIRPEILAKLRRPFVLNREVIRAPIVPISRDILRQKLAPASLGQEGGPAIEIRGIDAPSQPGVSWEVHLGQSGFRPGPESLVGIFALFSAGLRDRGHHFSQGEFVFPIGKALHNLDPSRLEVQFVAVSGLEDQRPTAVASAKALQTQVRVGEVNLILDAPMGRPPAEEQEKLRREDERR